MSISSRLIKRSSATAPQAALQAALRPAAPAIDT